MLESTSCLSHIELLESHLSRYVIPAIGASVVGFTVLLAVSTSAQEMIGVHPGASAPEKVNSVTQPEKPDREPPATQGVPHPTITTAPSPLGEREDDDTASPESSVSTSADPSETSDPEAGVEVDETHSPKAVVKPVPTKTNNGKHKGQDKGNGPNKSNGNGRSKIRQGLDEVVPGLKKLPDWALPIVARAQEKAAPGTVIHAKLDSKGRLVLNGKVKVQKKNGKHGGLMLMVSYRKPQTSIMDVQVVIEDPTTATRKAPAKVTVTVTDPKTSESETKTAKITNPDPEKVEAVTVKTLDKAVKATGDDAAVVAPAQPLT
jgi:hypothetical protein